MWDHYYDEWSRWIARSKQRTEEEWQLVPVITSPASEGDVGRPKGKPRPRVGKSR